jgi:hypothetical protein
MFRLFFWGLMSIYCGARLLYNCDTYVFIRSSFTKQPVFGMLVGPTIDHHT